MDTLFAYDNSGSTCNFDHYHEVSKKILTYLPTQATIVKWSTTWEKITRHELARINDRQEGNGGTLIQTIAEAIRSLEFTGHLILITDGDVNNESIDACDRMLDRDAIKRADIYIVGDNANMSVSCPFTRTCPHRIRVFKNEHLEEDISVQSDDIALLENLETIASMEMFDESYERILRALTSRMMGRQDTDVKIHDQIVRLQNRLRKAFLDDSADVQMLEELVSTNRDVEALDALKRIVTRDVIVPEFQTKIDALLNISRGGLRNVFTHGLRRAPEIVAQSEIELDDDDLPFFCPITFDVEHGVALLIKAGPPVFQDLSPNLVKDVMANPLNALHHAKIKDAIRALIDVPISGKAYDSYDIRTSPLTRSPLKNALYLGTHASQIEGTNAALADILAGGKRPGNLDLWYIVFYKIMETIPHLQDILPFARQHLEHRLKHRFTYAALSNRPLPFNPKVSLGLAFWIIAVLPLLELPRACDFSLSHVFHMPLIHELAGVNIPEQDRLREHARRMKALYRLQMLHKNSRRTFKNLIRALYQNAVWVNDTWIPLDGPASKEQQRTVLDQLGMDNAEEAHYLASLTDPQTSYPSLSIRAHIPDLPPYDVSWPYGINAHYKPNKLSICPRTQRPHAPWKEQAEAFYGAPVSQLISCNECYVRYVHTYKKYPETVDEFVHFMYRYYVVHRNRPSLPAPIVQFASEVLAENTSRIPIEAYLTSTRNKGTGTGLKPC